MARTWLAISASAEDANRLAAGGPRRDFAELAAAVNGRLVFREGARAPKGWLGRLFGAHIRQAWALSRQVNRGDTVFADGEHIGIPLLLFLALQFRRPARVVMLGHLVTRGWKLTALWFATRLGPPGALVVHSASQADIVRGRLARSWRTALVPYQADTAFWCRELATSAEHPETEPLVVAVGSEHRDYDTLSAAVDGLPVRVVIAAGSHWARATAGSDHLPENVTYVTEPLGFTELRDLYARATVVVVPVHDVLNQSGVTTILEAMSMGLPVVVTASRGQRECIVGPLVTPEGTLERAPTASRGPRLFGDEQPEAITGLYVPPGDPAALRAAIARLAGDAALRETLGRNAREAAVRHFAVERYAAAVAAEMAADQGVTPNPAPVAQP